MRVKKLWAPQSGVYGGGDGGDSGDGGDGGGCRYEETDDRFRK
jgi:hypothetical protein